MAPEWWEAAYLRAMSEHDPDEYGGREWDELTDDERTLVIELVLDDSAHEYRFERGSA